MTPPLFGILLMSNLLTPLIGSSPAPSSVSAQGIQETLFVDHLPDPLELTELSSRPGKRNYLFQARNAWATDLERILTLQGAQRIQIESDRFPAEDTASSWKKLAASGVEFIGFGTGIPVDQEIRQLNAIHFPRVILALSRFPTPEESNRLKLLQGNWSITFATSAFPKFEDKAGLEALPVNTPLFFVTSYWPAYTHMDLLNLLPHSKAIRVTGGYFPPNESLPYLKNIKKIDSLSIETEVEPQPTEWSKLRDLPLTWICKNFVPSEGAIQAFIEPRGTQNRKLVLDTDHQLTSAERDRLSRMPVTVDWIHLP